MVTPFIFASDLYSFARPDNFVESLSDVFADSKIEANSFGIGLV